MKSKTGWYNRNKTGNTVKHESHRHALASKGIKTSAPKGSKGLRVTATITPNFDMVKKGKKYIKPQTTLKNAKVIKKIGKWTIEQYISPADTVRYAITNGFVLDYPIIYHSGEVAFDYPEEIPMKVRDWFKEYAQKTKKKTDMVSNDKLKLLRATQFVTKRYPLADDEFKQKKINKLMEETNKKTDMVSGRKHTLFIKSLATGKETKLSYPLMDKLKGQKLVDIKNKKRINWRIGGRGFITRKNAEDWKKIALKTPPLNQTKQEYAKVLKIESTPATYKLVLRSV